MDLHPPGGPVRSVKDFLVHIGVVTLGILIALGLEQLVDAHHRAGLASAAVAGFRKELAYNEGEINYVMEAIPKMRTQIASAIELLSAPPTATDTQIVFPGFSVNVMSMAGWETAVATQALNELPFEAVTRYSSAYQTLRLFAEAEQSQLAAWQELRKFGVDVNSLSKEQRAAVVQELRRYENILIVIDFAGKGALRGCDAALR